jgi:hypothetical protein
MMICRLIFFYSLGLLNVTSQAHDSHDLRQNVKLKKSRPKKGQRESACIDCERLLFSSFFPRNAHRILEDSPDDHVFLDNNPDDFISLISDFSDFIYENDDLRCILLSMVKHTRELVCSGALDDLVVEQSYFNDNNESERDEYITEEHDINVNVISHLITIANAEKSTSDIIDSFLTPTIHHDSEDKKLMWNRLVNLDEQSMLWNGTDKILKSISSAEVFFTKCQRYGIDEGACLLLFALSHTVDASICHYVEEKGCRLEQDCTSTLKFRTAFNSRMISHSLPFTVPMFGAVIDDIAAPCGSCIQSYHKCSALCNFADGYDKCNIITGFPI